jgi:hypothetical protein
MKGKFIFKPTFFILKQEVLGRTNRLLSLIRHGPHLKRGVQQFFCFLARIGGFLPSRFLGTIRGFFTKPLPSNVRGNFTEPLSSNDKGNFTEPLSSNDKGNFTEPLPSNDRGHTHTHLRDLISLVLFFQNKKSSLKKQ